MDHEAETIGHLVSRIVDGVGQLADLHVDLLRAEVERDARRLARELAPLAFGAPLLAVGYLFFSVATAMEIEPWVGQAGGFALVGGANMLAGAVAIQVTARQLGLRRVHSSTLRPEVELSLMSLATALAGPPSTAPHPRPATTATSRL